MLPISCNRETYSLNFSGVTSAWGVYLDAYPTWFKVPCFEYLTNVDTYTPQGDGSLLPIFLLYLVVSLDHQYYGWKPITVLSAATTLNTSFLLKQISASCIFDIPFYFGFNDWFGVFHKWISGAWYSRLSYLIYESYTDFHLL